MIAGGGFCLMAWELAWKRAMPMFPNEWRKGHWPEPRDTVDIVALPASHEYYRILDRAAALFKERCGTHACFCERVRP